MLRLEHPDTNMASNRDWLRASKDMTISAYDPKTVTFGPEVLIVVPVTPFSAAHPAVAGKRNCVRATEEESITLGPLQEIHPRQHASAGTLLRAKKRR